jgi:hypothetical protein
VDALVEAALAESGARGGTARAAHARDLIVAAVRMLRDAVPEGDVKLVGNAVDDLERALCLFAPYEHLRKVAVFGGTNTAPEHPDWQQAHRFAEEMAQRGWSVITGAGPGIMQAAQGGAGRDGSFGVSIRLPYEEVNRVIAGDAKLASFKYFFTRKVAFVKNAHAAALFPGGFGTHDEGFEMLTLIQTGKSEMLPVVFVDAPGGSYWRNWAEYVDTHLLRRGLIAPDDVALFRVTDDPREAADEITRFYRNYHSSRWLGDRLLLRVRQAPTDDALARPRRRVRRSPAPRDDCRRLHGARGRRRRRARHGAARPRAHPRPEPGPVAPLDRSAERHRARPGCDDVRGDASDRRAAAGRLRHPPVASGRVSGAREARP